MTTELYRRKTDLHLTRVDEHLDAHLTDVDKRLTSHEAVCVERYNQILKTNEVVSESIEDLKTLLMRASVAMFTGMAGILGALLWKLLKL